MWPTLKDEDQKQIAEDIVAVLNEVLKKVGYVWSDARKENVMFRKTTTGQWQFCFVDLESFEEIKEKGETQDVTTQHLLGKSTKGTPWI